MAGRSVDLLLKITAQTAGAVREVDKVAGGLKGVGTQTGKTQGLIGSAVSSVQGALAGLPPYIQAIIAGTGAAGVAFGKFALDGAQKFADLTSEVRNVQRATGATAEESSRLAAAFTATGVSVDTGTAALTRLAVGLGKGTVDLQQYGIETARNKDGTVDLAGTLANVAAVYSRTGDVTARAALGQAAFGKGFQALSPILLKSKQDIQELYKAAAEHGLIFNQEDLEKGRQFNIATQELNAAIDGLQASIGSALVPALTEAAQAMTTVVDGINAAKDIIPGDLFGPIAKSAISSFPIIGPALGAGIDAIGFLSDASDDGASSTDQLAAAQRASADAAKAEADAINQAVTAIKNRNDATIASFSSDIAAQKANIDLAQAIAGGKTGLDLQSQALDTATAGARLLADQYTATSGRTADATQKNEFLKASLQQIATQYPALRGLVQGYIDKLNAVPHSITQAIILDTQPAIDSLANFRARIANDPVYVHLVAVGAAGVSAGGAGIRRASGGPIPGAAGQAVPITAHGGEYVLDAGTVAAIKRGGPSSNARFRGGSSGSGAGGINVTVIAGSAHPAQVGAAVVDSLKAYERGNGSSWRNN